MIELEVLLRDGTPVSVRPVVPTDKEKLEAAMGRLSPEARRQRFFSSKAHLGDSLLAHLTEIDYTAHFAWIALAVDQPGQPIVGVGRYVRVSWDDGLAEIALVVGERYQRRGLATILLELLAITARSHGIDRFQAFVLADNLAMRDLLVRQGAVFHLDEPGVVQTIIDVPPATGNFDPIEVLGADSSSGARMVRQRPVAPPPLDRLGWHRPDGGPWPDRLTG
jgi:RimJ/RimL family protein N-acetyltransferase